MCEHNHPTCLGPVCTLNSSPKRPLQGAAKDKARVFDEIAALRQPDSKHVCSTTTSFYDLNTACHYMLKAEYILRSQSTNQFSINMFQNAGKFLVRIELKKIKI